MTNELSDTPQGRLVVLIQTELGRESGYHRHKEAMAYSGLALFVGVVGAVLISKEWPPMAWGDNRETFGALALLLLWIGVLKYLRFQLQMRRRAALRVTGLQIVLARWACDDLDLNGLKAKRRPAFDQMPLWQCLVDLVWPQQASVRVMNGLKDPEPPWPDVLVDAWIEAEKLGTEAIRHERLIIVSAWVLFIVSIFRTLFAA